MKTRSLNEASHFANVSSNGQKTNSLQSEPPTKTTVTEYQAQQKVAGQSTRVRIQQAVVNKGANKRANSSDERKSRADSGTSPTHGFRDIKRIRTDEPNPGGLSQFTAGEVDEARLKYLAENTVEHMRDRIEAINAESSSDKRIKGLAEILINAPATVQRQVVENFVKALSPETDEQPDSVLSEEALNFLITHLEQAPTSGVATSNNGSSESIGEIARGILDGLAATPDLDDETTMVLLDAVSFWCSDPVNVSDKDLRALHKKVVSIMQTLTPDFRDSFECIESVCYARIVDANLANIPDEKLAEVMKKLRFCAKWFFNQESPGHTLNTMFTRLIDRIDERQPSIGAIPEIAHVVWMGKPVSEECIENLVGFLRHNKNYELMIGTDRPQETQRVIDRVSEQNPEAARLLAKVTPCHYKEWLPADDEWIGDVSGAEIRTLVETLRSGPGKVYPGASDILRLLGLRSEKTVNGERTRGGLYFDVDLLWLKALPRLSSPLGITLNSGPDGFNNNVLGFPTDVELIDGLIQTIVDGYRDRNLDTVMEDVAGLSQDIAETIEQMNSDYERTRTRNIQPEPTRNDPKYEFDTTITEDEKRAIRDQNRARAREILAQFHPAQNKLDYSRFPYANDGDDNSRLALTLVLSGPGCLKSFLEVVFSKDFDTHERFNQLGIIGGTHGDPVRPDQVYTESSRAEWQHMKPGRRASIGGTTTLGELENAPTGQYR